jgi:uncharacterized protein (TIGR00255 family)
MSGFGKAVSSFDGFSFEVEVKSLNNRYLEFSLKLPSSLQNKEFELKEFIKSKVKRGKIYINMVIKSQENNGSLLNLKEDKLIETISLLKKIRKIINSKEKVKLEHILSFRDLFSPDLLEFNDEHFEILKNTIGQALDQLIEMRNTEGKQLSKDLFSRIDKIENHVLKIEEIHRGEIESSFEKLKERAKQLVENITDYSDRLEVELALLAERSDITEECVRLRAHLKYFKESLKKEDEVGRKLNFICQEMHRETNTIASKSLSSDITYCSVLIREEVEKIREQIQNIE